MAIIPKILSHILVVLSIITNWTLATEPDCQIIKANTLSGNFKHLTKPNCSWTYIAPTGMNLLFKVDNVRFLPHTNSSLKIFADDKVIEIPRSCVKCLQKMISAHTVKLLYQSYSNSTSEFPDEVSAFQIRYRAYHPDVCDKPSSPVNGFVTVVGQKLGQDIYYSCSPPYQMTGVSRAQCVIPDNSPVPQWSNGPPTCFVPNCTEEPIERKTSSGAIASPGYPTYRLHSSLRCVWVLTVDVGYQIKASFSVVHLTGSRNESIGSLLLYDGDENRPFLAFNQTIFIPYNFSTKTNKLLVRLITFNKDIAEGGFLMVYSTIRGSCFEPSPPHFGEVVAYSLSVGSVISYRCMPGYSLVGHAQAECLSGGVWSSKKPRCQLVTTVTPPTSPRERTKSVLPVHNSTVLAPTVLVADNRPTTYSYIVTEKIVPMQDSSHPNSSKSSSATTGVDLVPNSSIPVPKAQNKNIFVSLTNTALENGVEEKLKSPSKDNEEEVEDSVSDFGSQYVPNELHPTANEDKEDSKHGAQSTFTTFVVVGVASGVLIIFLSVIVIALLYKKHHPMGMRFRRKFSTFENPMYVRKETCHPRELKRLTV